MARASSSVPVARIRFSDVLLELRHEVAEGDAVAIMEAMKMEMRVVAPKGGRIRIHGEAGRPVTAGEKIAVIE